MTALVFLCGIGSAMLAMAVVPLSGVKMDAILMSMPALVYVLAVSGSLHYLNYYRSLGAKDGYQSAAYEAVLHAWRPAVLCAVTTACGLLSLLVSDITPIRRFGAFSAVGVLLTLVVLFAFLPATLVVWPWKPARVVRSEASGVNATFWRIFAKAIERRYGMVLLTSLGVIAALAGGLPRTTTSVDLLKLFSPDAQLIQDYQWFEDRIGKLVPAEIVVRFPARALRESLPETATPRAVATSYTFLERMEIVQRVESTIRRRLGAEGDGLVGATMSAATFAPDLAQHRGIARRYATNEELLHSRPNLERSGYLRTDPQSGEELWRVTVRCAAFHEVERDDIVASIRDVVQPVTAGSFGGAEALASASRFADESSEPLQVAVYAPNGMDDATQAAAQLAQGRGFRVSVLEQPLATADQSARDAIASRDLILVAEGGEAALTELQSKTATAQLVNESGDDGAIEVVYTGVLPIVYKAQRELLNSLVQSTWWSFATIAPLMVFVCRSLLGGLLVMVPNALPILVVFGGMAWLGIPVDIGSMMAASIALGVAVDDTIHFLAWYREDIERLGGRSAAVLSAYQRSAAPTLQAGLVNGLGLSVFAMSSFVPTQRFGVLMLAILGAGIVAELILLPALLFSPLGRVFDPSPRRTAISAAPNYVPDGVA
jgi:predicted RND superfamily exporter protein